MSGGAQQVRQGQKTETTVTSENKEKKKTKPLILRLKTTKKDEEERVHVTWASDVVDNEHLGRLKSNCCCIWVKPRRWDDPSTWEQDECETEHCRGHTLPLPDQSKKKEENNNEDDKKKERKGS